MDRERGNEMVSIQQASGNPKRRKNTPRRLLLNKGLNFRN